MLKNSHEQNSNGHPTTTDLDMTPVFHGVGLPYEASSSEAFEKKYKLRANSAVGYYELLWGVHLAIHGEIPSSRLRTRRGRALRLELPLLQSAKSNEDAKLVICISREDQLRLILPEEFEEPSKYRILVAENDEIIAEAMNRKLSRAGFEVAVARTGAAALDLVRGENFDLALIDVDLQDIHGFALCARLHTEPSTKELPVVICSAWHGSGELAARAGAVGYLEKPQDFGGLAERIRTFLGLPPATSEPQAG